MSPSRYCLTLGTAALAIAGAIAALNYVVDPYLLFDVKRVAGLNDLKPAAATKERMMKAYQVERTQARTIVIGSSRPDLGIDPASNAWPAAARPVYNMSLVGADVPEGFKYLRHYVAVHPGQGPQTLVVGLDFEASLYVPKPKPKPAGPVPPRPMSELEERLAVDLAGRPNPARGARVLKDHAQGLLSLDALYDSLYTLRSNHADGVLSLETNGHLSEAATRDVVRTDGYARVFDQKNLDTIAQYAKPHRVLSDTPDGPIPRLVMLRDLLGFARQSGIDVVLMIQPAHVSRLELLDRMGYWNDYERWKRELAAMAAQANGQDGRRVTLWDFGGYEQQVLETAPAKGKGTMAWFWDPVHYNGKLGNAMITRMFGPAAGNTAGNVDGADGFGIVLTPANVDAHLAQVRADRDAYRSAMPEETARLARLVCGTSPCPAPASTLASAR